MQHDNLYKVTTNQETIRAFTRSTVDIFGNLEPSFDVYPDQMAPIVRNRPAGRELTILRWGVPSSRRALFQAASKRADKLHAKTWCFADMPLKLRALFSVLRVIGLFPAMTSLTVPQLREAVLAAGFDIAEERIFGKHWQNPYIVARKP